MKKKEEEEYKREKETNKRWRVKYKVRLVTEKNHMNNNLFAYFCESEIISEFLFKFSIADCLKLII